MSLRVTNTRTGEREPFEPKDPDEVLLYYCGLTVSDHAHLGHARSWVHVDVMHRWLDHSGYTVRHVENVTDVNEKIAARVGEVGDSEREVAAHYLASVIEDMRGLNLKRAEVYPRVTEHVPEIIDLVERLIARGYAYESNGSVYFDVTEFEGYGDLSNQSGLEAALPVAFPEAEVATEYGVRLTFADGSWTLVRPSGTEPYLRVYAESDRVDALTDEVREVVEAAVE